MKTFKISLTAQAENADDAKRLAALLQDVANKVAYADIVKLLSAASKNPGVVKTALKFM